MKIIFGNQKGGVGKTSLAILFANYLSSQNKKVIAIEMDIQKSMASTRKHEVENGNVATNQYEIVYTPLNDYPKFAEALKNTNVNLVIDLPGKLDDPSLVPILKDADVIVCPFDYDLRSFISTVTFATVVKQLDSKKAIIFVPNRIRTSINYELKDKVNEKLSAIGLVTDIITERVALKRLSTFGITEEQKSIVGKIFDLIIQKSKIE
jgi:chromosome partitioning protein